MRQTKSAGAHMAKLVGQPIGSNFRIDPVFSTGCSSPNVMIVNVNQRAAPHRWLGGATSAESEVS